MRTLTINLDGKYFAEIKSGRKPEEYREVKSYWIKRLAGKHFDQVVFCLGYPKKDDVDRRIVCNYIWCYIKEIVHPKFGNTPTKVFAIPVLLE